MSVQSFSEYTLGPPLNSETMEAPELVRTTLFTPPTWATAFNTLKIQTGTVETNLAVSVLVELSLLEKHSLSFLKDEYGQ